VTVMGPPFALPCLGLRCLRFSMPLLCREQVARYFEVFFARLVTFLALFRLPVAFLVVTFFLGVDFFVAGFAPAGDAVSESPIFAANFPSADPTATATFFNPS